MSCLCGHILFIAYRASLTTLLTTSTYELPFESLEELSETDYRYHQIMDKRLLGLSKFSPYRLIFPTNLRYHIQRLENAPLSTLDGKVFRQNMMGSR